MEATIRSGFGRVDLEVDDQPARRERLLEGLAAVVGDQHRRQHGVEGVQLVVAQDDLVQVGVGHPRDRLPRLAAVVGADQAEEVRQRAELVRVAAAEQLAGAARAQLEERPDRRGLAGVLDRARDRRDGLAVAGDAEEAAVRREQEVLRGRVDVQRVHERRLGLEVHEPVRGRLRGRARRRLRLAPAAAGGEREREDDRRARPHEPACASSHSANIVNPTMIPSIQYWERTANRA